ncbi:MAG: BlaI/MecI/CopY family transcriptional regulator [Lachnospiraceae bacterium]|nr:BlaI/MecI/CopY family transcriptional regulator [Lachnospiraceae bacterium]
MSKDERMPSESEWLVMEVLWESSVPLTSIEVIKRVQRSRKMSAKTVRVLMNRLYKKEIIDYTIDKKDARIYHYFTVKSKEECLREKSRKFVDSYFSGNPANALAALLQSGPLTDEQIEELEAILEQSRGSERQ